MRAKGIDPSPIAVPCNPCIELKHYPSFQAKV
jgi:hypothetical protein